MVDFEHMANTNVEVARHGNENIAGLMRRFSRKMQSSGVLKRVRALRYHSRAESDARTKKAALTKIKRREWYVEQDKLGRVVEKKKRR